MSTLSWPPSGGPANEPRQRLLGLAVVVACALALGLIVAALRPASPHAAAGRPPASGRPAASAPATPAPTIPEQARRQVWTSDTASTGQYRTNTITAAASGGAATTRSYLVKVETSVQAAPDEVAREVHAVLSDPRSWVGYGKNRFQLVNALAPGVVVLYVASPRTTDRLCSPEKVNGLWSCRKGNAVVLNSDRWQYMIPSYDDLAAFRAYMVNHEVGHLLGQLHATCPKKGGKAPVMMQQHLSLGACVPNAWPRTSD